jgi:hypothetical protein
MDAKRQLISAEHGLYLRTSDGRMRLVHPVEAADGPRRSNDGWVHPSGTFWFSAMGRGAEPGVGAIYAYQRGAVSCLIRGVTIPNVPRARSEKKPACSRNSGAPHRSRTNASLFEPEQQIIIDWLDVFSDRLSTLSRWSGTPSTTRTSQLPQTPSLQEWGASIPAASRASRIVWLGATTMVRFDRARVTIQPPFDGRADSEAVAKRSMCTVA